MNPGSEEFDKANTCSLFYRKKELAEYAFIVEKPDLKNLYIIPLNIDLAVTETKLVIGRNINVKADKSSRYRRCKKSADVIQKCYRWKANSACKLKIRCSSNIRWYYK